jgi:hypothetical protein
MAQALKDIVAYLETGDKSHLQEARKNVDSLELLIKQSQKEMETESKRRRRR